MKLATGFLPYIGIALSASTSTKANVDNRKEPALCHVVILKPAQIRHPLETWVETFAWVEAGKVVEWHSPKYGSVKVRTDKDDCHLTFLVNKLTNGYTCQLITI